METKNDIQFDFFIVRDYWDDEIPSEEYDLWQVDQAAKREGAIDVRDVKRVDIISLSTHAASLRLDHRLREQLDTHPAGDSILPVSLLYFDGMEVVFSVAGAALAFLKIIKPIIIEWLKNNRCRNIRVKGNGLDILINGSNDIDKVIKIFSQLQNRNERVIQSLNKLELPLVINDPIDIVLDAKVREKALNILQQQGAREALKFAKAEVVKCIETFNKDIEKALKQPTNNLGWLNQKKDYWNWTMQEINEELSRLFGEASQTPRFK